jgi:hypothetical protein
MEQQVEWVEPYETHCVAPESQDSGADGIKSNLCIEPPQGTSPIGLQTNISQETLPVPSRRPAAPLLLPLRLLVRPARIFWVLLLGIVALIQFAYANRPRLDIETSVALDQHDPLTTLFRVTNTGHWHVNEVRFSCNVFIPGIESINMEGNVIMNSPYSVPTGQSGVARLNPGQSMTRDCNIDAFNQFFHIPYIPVHESYVDRMQLLVTVKFRWPFLRLPDTVTRTFTVRKYKERVILVPDTQ